MKKNISKIVLLLALVAMPALSAPLDPSLVGTWLSFGWVGGIGSHGFGGFADYTGGSGTFVKSTGICGAFATDADCAFSGSYTITISDLFVDGDQFQLYDNGILIGTTSAPTNDFTDCGNDPVACAGAQWSHGTFSLGSGNHQLDIVLIAQTTGIASGRGAFIFNGAGAVPEPATFGLIGLGLVGVALRLRKKRA